MKNKHQLHIKFCLHCGIEMKRKRYNGRLEDRKMFLRRKYCSQDCSSIASRKESVTTSGAYKRATLLKGSTCQNCGSTKNVGVHHKDRDIHNNSEENLLTLCASCHTKMHWEEGKLPWRERQHCKICGDPVKGHGYCSKHYQRFRKYGDPNLTKKHGQLVHTGKLLNSEGPGSTSCDCVETASCREAPRKPSEPCTEN